MRHPLFSARTPRAVAAALVPIGIAFLSVRSPAAAPDPTPVTPDPAGAAYFEKNIRPILTASCIQCHSAEKGVTKGGLALDTQAGWLKGGDNGPVITVGKPDSSKFFTAISYTNEDLQMPPGGKLPDDKVALLKQWIAHGAPDTRIAAPGTPGGEHRLSGLTEKAKEHWAFQGIEQPALPHVDDPSGWIHDGIDTFVLANLHGHGMHPNGKADRETLMRRAYYDMIGQPPTVGEVRAFLSDRSPDAWSKVVNNLLASPHYGERWGRHWLDSARYSDASGEKNQQLADYRFPYAWTYRDYVINSLNADKPYNDFLIEQIAADKLPGIQPNDPRLAALGFLTVGKHFQNPDDLIDERIDTVTKATMALTVSCARCHDHKFDPVPTADYYSLYGVFSNTVEPAEKPLLAGGFDGAQQADFDRKLDGLIQQNQAMYYDWLAGRMSEFRRNAEGYLLAAAQPGRSTERSDILRKYNLPDGKRGPSREILNSLKMNPNDPVLGPFARLSRIPADRFSTEAVSTMNAYFKNKQRATNPIIRGMLSSLHARNLTDVAHAYGLLFARAQRQSDTLLAARRSGTIEPSDPGGNVTAVIETPFAIPTPTMIATPEDQLTYFDRGYMDPQTKNQFVFPAINELRLTHAGAPGRAMVVADSAVPKDAFIHIRGDKTRRGPVVPRQFLELFSGPNRQPFTNGSGRLELARDIASNANPMTARALVNRVWMDHFGEGFVRTPDDLGNQSEAPSDQKLLDFLASYLMNNGWSLKKLHRLILMSSTYQESSADNQAYDLRDPEDRLQWRSQVRRLDFEAIRDSLVMLTGKLDPSIGGKPVNITDEPYTYRRSIYGYVDRSDLSDLMRQFDFSDPAMPNTARTSTIVPQQALFFLNSPMTVDVARQLVARPDVADSTTDAAKVQAMYLALFQRSPRPEEITLAEKFVTQAGTLAAPDPNSLAMPVVGKNGKPRRRAVAPKPQIAVNRAAKNARAPIENEGLPVSRAPLTPWELYAQALLCSNEFVYVD